MSNSNALAKPRDPLTPKGVAVLLKDTFSAWSEDKASRLGAAVAYYTIFSMAPLLIVVISIAGLVFGAQAVRGQLVGQIQGMVGAEGATMIQTMIANASRPSDGILATVIGIITLLLGATGLFGELQDALNTIWEIAPKPRGPLMMIKERFLSFGMILGIAFLLLVSLLISSVLAAMGQLMSSMLPVPEVVLQLIDLVISFAIITLLFAAMYKVLPDAEIAWHDVLIGAVVTSALFSIGKLLIGLYLGHSGTASTYGAAGSLVVLLLWIYYSAQILFFGAEFTQLYANRYGRGVQPSANAVPLADVLLKKDARPDVEPRSASAPTTGSDGARRQPVEVRGGLPSLRGTGAVLDLANGTISRRPSPLALLAAVIFGVGVKVARSKRGQHTITQS